MNTARDPIKLRYVLTHSPFFQLQSQQGAAFVSQGTLPKRRSCSQTALKFPRISRPWRVVRQARRRPNSSGSCSSSCAAATHQCNAELVAESAVSLVRSPGKHPLRQRG